MVTKSAYLHIPFCRRRCFYCDFPITVLGDRGGVTYSPWQKEYVGFICEEIALTAKIYKRKSSLETVFFGGGTPSLLAIEGLETILSTLNRYFPLSKNAEISLEIDPATFDLIKLKQYQNLGVNRISLGVQAFQDHLLLNCGRTHQRCDINEAINYIYQTDFENWSLDLISGLPHQTLTDWEESLNSAIALKPKHISCYDMILEPMTVFGKKYQEGDKPLPPEETTAQMYCFAQEKLTEAGYNHYEISNYAQRGYECRHNQVYWHNQSYYGFGMGAASYIDNQRFTRPPTRKEYFAWVENLKDGKKNFDTPILSKKDQLLETLMLGFRLTKGVNLEKIESEFGKESTDKILKCLDNFINNNLIIFDTNNFNLSLTDPQGFLYSNTILSSLFAEFD